MSGVTQTDTNGLVFIYRLKGGGKSMKSMLKKLRRKKKEGREKRKKRERRE